MAMMDEEAQEQLTAALMSVSETISEKLVRFILSQNIVGKRISEKDMSDSEAAASALVLFSTMIKVDYDSDRAIIGVIEKMFERGDVPADISISTNLFVTALAMARDTIASITFPSGQQEGHC